MNGPFVADSSVAIGWVCTNQSNALTERLLVEASNDAVVHVPAIWHLEVANGLLSAVRRKILTDPQRQAGLALIGQLKVVVDDQTSQAAFSTISDLASKYSLSAYDAAYLELARRMSLPLGSRDEALIAAARKSGITIL